MREIALECQRVRPCRRSFSCRTACLVCSSPSSLSSLGGQLAYAVTVWDRQRLEDHVEAVARLVRKRGANWEPEVVLSKLPPALIQ
jgi:hypothetical protein